MKNFIGLETLCRLVFGVGNEVCVQYSISKLPFLLIRYQYLSPSAISADVFKDVGMLPYSSGDAFHERTNSYWV